MIKISGIHKFFNKGRQNEIHVLNDVSLDLPEKGMVAIFGKSGCGKTTLLNVIGGLDKFSVGSLTIEGQSIGVDTDVLRNKYIGYIFQNYNLNRAESCYDNVADALRLCGMTDEVEILSRVTAALRNVGMAEYAKRTPDTLSGGQQQRIAIARAIVKNPRIILADEPTGNLDEANTVMIMDLLKAISKDHLVLLVTHEAKLVDHYCDKVIELQDGKIVGERENVTALGYEARDKNDVYLGELERQSAEGEWAEIEYYGDAPKVPLKLKIVNSEGRIYLKIDSDKVSVIDDSSEIRLREGVYEHTPEEGSAERAIDMSDLPPISGTRFGRLFTLKSSLKSGYAANFKSRKKNKRALHACLAMFAAVVVFVSSIFGGSFSDIIDAQNAYNHSTFYVYTPGGKTSKLLNEAVGNVESGIDYVRLTEYTGGDRDVYFRTGSFETFSQFIFENSFYTNAVYLSASQTEGMRLVSGRRELRSDEEILISTKVADALIEKSTVGYIKERADLLGLVCDSISVDGKSGRIVGVVESDAPEIYLGDLALAISYLGPNSSSRVDLAKNFGFSVKQGEAILAVSSPYLNATLPKVGDTIKIQGKDIRVSEIRVAHTVYTSWLDFAGVSKLDEDDYFKEALKQERPDLAVESNEFKAALEEMKLSRHFEYYDYLYSEFDSYLKNRYFFETDNMDLWLYTVKGVELAKFSFLPDDYYKAYAYKALHGIYPTESELNGEYGDLPDIYDELKIYYDAHSNEFYSSGFYTVDLLSYLVSEEDYIDFSKELGETHATAEYGEKYAAVCYTLVHSTNPEKTAAWIEANLPNHPDPSRYMKGILTPNDILAEIIKDKTQDIVGGFITMALFLLLMSVCMYFIMRSSVINRVKEVGIYRAIGVSRKNLVFKFFIESALLCALTVFVGYLLTSTFMYLSINMSAVMTDIFYYPLWLAGADLLLLVGISLLFGTIPIISLLTKTPSEILAKYDI